jgi:hypothetical protein
MSANCFWQTWDKMDKTLPLARRTTVTVAMMKSRRERNGVRLPKNGMGSCVHYQVKWPISTPSLRISALKSEDETIRIPKGPAEGGSGGKRGPSGVEHWGYTDEVKDAAKRRRRIEDKEAMKEESGVCEGESSADNA